MRTTVIFLFLFFAASVMQAQSSCYDQPQYGVRSEYDVVYGSDVDFAGRVVDLKMNIHRPVGDHNPQRPVVVMIHGGGFIEGDRSQMDNDVLPVCQYFASLGYTAVTIDYRLGMQKSDLIGDALPCGIAN
nr:carboxylesterase family protein [Flavilitoribacter sp.]